MKPEFSEYLTALLDGKNPTLTPAIAEEIAKADAELDALLTPQERKVAEKALREFDELMHG